MKEKIIVFCISEAGEETRVPGSFNSDKEAVAAIKEPGDYIFYKVLAVKKEDIKAASHE